MSFTTDLLDSAKKALAIESDYKLAQALGIERATVSNYRVGSKSPANPITYRLAQLAGIDPDMAVIRVNLERGTSPEDDEVWRSLGERIRAKAAEWEAANPG